MTGAEKTLLEKLELLEKLRPMLGGVRDPIVWSDAWEKAWKEALSAAKQYLNT